MRVISLNIAKKSGSLSRLWIASCPPTPIIYDWRRKRRKVVRLVRQSGYRSRILGSLFNLDSISISLFSLILP